MRALNPGSNRRVRRGRRVFCGKRLDRAVLGKSVCPQGFGFFQILGRATEPIPSSQGAKRRRNLKSNRKAFWVLCSRRGAGCAEQSISREAAKAQRKDTGPGPVFQLAVNPSSTVMLQFALIFVTFFCNLLFFCSVF